MATAAYHLQEAEQALLGAFLTASPDKTRKAVTSLSGTVSKIRMTNFAMSEKMVKLGHTYWMSGSKDVH